MPAVFVRTLVFLTVRRVLGLVGLGPTPDAKDVEIAVLRHQLMVLNRQVARPRYAPTDPHQQVTVTSRVQHRRGHPDDVVLVQAGQRRTQIQPSAHGDARRDPQHLFLTARARQPPAIQRRHHRSPFHERHRRVAHQVQADLDESADEVATPQPPLMPDQQLGGRLGRVQTLRVRPQRRRQVPETGSESGLRLTPRSPLAAPRSSRFHRARPGQTRWPSGLCAQPAPNASTGC
jgi:hypothetical protein